MLQFLRSHSNHKDIFIFPKIKDEEIVPVRDVICMFPIPEETRGLFHFPYNVL